MRRRAHAQSFTLEAGTAAAGLVRTPSSPPRVVSCNLVYPTHLPTPPTPPPRRPMHEEASRRGHFLAFLCEGGVGFFSTPKAPEW